MNEKTREKRRVVPVELEDEDLLAPSESARPGLAAWLLAAPVLAVVGLLAWARLCFGVDTPLSEELGTTAMIADFCLILLFCLPHSLLARGSGRRFLNRLAGPEAERPIYVLVSGLSLCALVFWWQTGGPMLWNHEGALLVVARLLQASGLLLALWAALVSGGGDLLGLPQLRALERGHSAPGRELVALPPYRWLRQPINAGILLFLAGSPEGTPDRLLMIVCIALWIVLSAPYEERDSEITFGSAYLDYKERTPRWIPRSGNRNK